MLDKICYIPYNKAKEVIQEYHYSKVLPRITKECIGGYIGDKIVGVATLGYGVRPLHTIRKAFPTLGVKDYYELGKLCLSDDCPRNTESFFISRMIRKLKERHPELKLLYSWADGIIGKPGYVYQASNFYYGGFIWTEMYLDENGTRVHPRTLQGMSTGEKVGKFKSRAYDVTTGMGMTKYFGLQFRYVFPLCDKREWRRIMATSPFTWTQFDYPKDADCKWKVQISKGKREDCELPPFITTEYTKGRIKEADIKLFFE